MTFDDLYARTLIRRDWHVCGERMLPLAVGHARIIESLRLWHPLTWVDLMLCAWVCGRSPERFRMPRGPWERLCWQVRAMRLRKAHSLDVHLGAWEAYVSHHMEMPVVTWSSGRDASSPGTPQMVAIRAGLIRIGYRPDTVDQVPVDVAIMDLYSGLEGTGHVKVVNRSQGDLEEAYKRCSEYVHSLGKN